MFTLTIWLWLTSIFRNLTLFSNVCDSVCVSPVLRKTKTWRLRGSLKPSKGVFLTGPGLTTEDYGAWQVQVSQNDHVREYNRVQGAKLDTTDVQKLEVVHAGQSQAV